MEYNVGDTVYVGGAEKTSDYIVELHPFVVTATIYSRVHTRIKDGWVEGFPIAAEFARVGFTIKRGESLRFNKFRIFRTIEEYEKHQTLHERESEQHGKKTRHEETCS